MIELTDANHGDEEFHTERKPKKGTLIVLTWHRLFPSGFKQELKSLLHILIPCVLTGVFRFLNPMISLIMCGQLNKLKFDAAALANSIIDILGVSIDLGFSTAFDTLFAQIYGCDQKKKMGFLLQRATIIMTLLYLVLACFHLNIEPVLIWLKQDPEVAELTAKYISIYLPGLFFDFHFLTVSRYLQSQDIVYPMMVSAFIGDVFSVISQYVAIHVYGYGLEASALLQGVSCFIMFAVQLGYVLFTKVYKESWDGFSLREAFTNWKIIFVLGIPGILMIGLENWNFEVATIIAGTLNQVQLGAQSIAFQCAALSFMFVLGLAIAVSIRIGQYLGSRDIDKIKTCLHTAIIVGACSSSISFTVILTMRTYLAKLFSNDPDIQDEGAKLLIFIAFNQFLDITAGIGAGVLKACGRQSLGALIMFICYYVMGVPLGIVLVYVVRIEIKGMWIGLMSALLVEGLIFSFLVSRTDWEAECDKAISNVESLENNISNETLCTEESTLLIKSDVEVSTRWALENHVENSVSFRKQKQRRTRSFSESRSTVANNRRTVFLLTPTTYNIETDEPLRKVLILRTITIMSVVMLFIASVLVRIYVPRSLYFPSTNNTIVPIHNTTII